MELAMPWGPGESGNPKGRKVGWRKPKQKLSLKQAAVRGDADALAFLSAVLADDRAGTPFRIQAAGLLLPYQRARVTARFIREEIDLPVSTTVEQATETIAKIGSLAAAGKLGLDEANDLVGHQKAYIEAAVGTDLEAQIAELRETVQKLSASSRALDVTVLGGLPNLPGSRVEMPTLRGPENVAASPTPRRSAREILLPAPPGCGAARDASHSRAHDPRLGRHAGARGRAHSAASGRS
jgi:hypothetical protein